MVGGAALSGSMTITVYYWPIYARNIAVLRILDYTNTPYEYVSARDKMAALCGCMGAESTTFAPPVVVDGDNVISQSIACTMYLGKKLLLMPEGFDEYKGLQFCLDCVDVFENGFGKNNEHGPTLKNYLSGDRWKMLMGNLERQIKGPYIFGDKPSPADFFLTQHMEWRTNTFFEPLKAKYGIDLLAAYPKLCGVRDAVQALSTYKPELNLNIMGMTKDEILDEFKP